MADPVLAGAIRVLVIWQGRSQLPEDRFINTFAFASDAAQTDAAKNACIDKLQTFYESPYGGQSIAQYLSTTLIDEATSEFRAYSLADPVGQREPLIRPWSTAQGQFGGAAPLPAEVAVCGSYYSGMNSPRNRGRIYIGPLNTSCLGAGGDSGRVTNELVVALNLGMKQLAATQPTLPRWSLLAKNNTTGVRELKPITNVWVDNAFDTQRRRGERATNRAVGVV